MSAAPLSDEFAGPQNDRAEPATPRALRASVSASAALRIGLARGSVDIADLSITGVKVRTLNPIDVGTAIWIKLPMLEALEARVVWYRNFEAGCEFVNPLHPAVFQVLVQKSGQPGR